MKTVNKSKEREELLQKLWAYDPEDEEGFRVIFKSFVDFYPDEDTPCRLLLISPRTRNLWVEGHDAPKLHFRASFKAIMIERIGEYPAED
jgi:hypothetical protein